MEPWHSDTKRILASLGPEYHSHASSIMKLFTNEVPIKKRNTEVLSADQAQERGKIRRVLATQCAFLQIQLQQLFTYGCTGSPNG